MRLPNLLQRADEVGGTFQAGVIFVEGTKEHPRMIGALTEDGKFTVIIGDRKHKESYIDAITRLSLFHLFGPTHKFEDKEAVCQKINDVIKKAPLIVGGGKKQGEKVEAKIQELGHKRKNSINEAAFNLAVVAVVPFKLFKIALKGLEKDTLVEKIGQNKDLFDLYVTSISKVRLEFRRLESMVERATQLVEHVSHIAKTPPDLATSEDINGAVELAQENLFAITNQFSLTVSARPIGDQQGQLVIIDSRIGQFFNSEGMTTILSVLPERRVDEEKAEATKERSVSTSLLSVEDYPLLD